MSNNNKSRPLFLTWEDAKKYLNEVSSEEGLGSEVGSDGKRYFSNAEMNKVERGWATAGIAVAKNEYLDTFLSQARQEKIKDNYTVIKEIDQGGFGQISLVEGPDGKQYAMKKLTSKAGGVTLHKQRFTRESFVQEDLHAHSSIPTIHEIISVDAMVQVIIMDYIEGNDLSYYVKNASEEVIKNAMNPTEKQKALDEYYNDTYVGLFKAFMDGCEAVAYMHGKGYMHRDISTNNIMIDGDGKGWLLDFGLTLDDDGQYGITKTGVLSGKVNYLAPERMVNRAKPASENEVTHQADIYSLGCVLYCLSSLKRPFAAPDVRQDLEFYTDYVIANRNHLVCDEISPYKSIIDPIVSRCTQYEPSSRYETVDELLQELTDVYSGALSKQKGKGKGIWGIAKNYFSKGNK